MKSKVKKSHTLNITTEQAAVRGTLETYNHRALAKYDDLILRGKGTLADRVFVNCALCRVGMGADAVLNCRASECPFFTARPSDYTCDPPSEEVREDYSQPLNRRQEDRPEPETQEAFLKRMERQSEEGMCSST
jgi:hypothetical protein